LPEKKVGYMDKELNILYARLIAQGKTFLEALSIIESVEILMQRLSK
jgi:hypothetical protein